MANVKISDMTAGGALGGTELFEMVQGALSRSTTAAALATLAGAALNASNLSSGTIPDARFPATLPALSGVNLTALNATALASGTVADARLSANVPLLNASNVFTGGNQLAVSSVNGNLSIYANNTSAAGTSAVAQLAVFDSNTQGLRIQVPGPANVTAVLTGGTAGDAGIFTDTARGLAFGTNGTQQLRISGAGAITLNGVDATDFARLSQANAFSVSAALIASWNSTNAAGPYTAYRRSGTDFGFIGNGGQMGGGYTADSLAIVGVAGKFIEFGQSGAPNLRLDDSATAGNTRMLIYDVDNATLERVTVGAADSGGAGFKVLRIPN